MKRIVLKPETIDHLEKNGYDVKSSTINKLVVTGSRSKIDDSYMHNIMQYIIDLETKVDMLIELLVQNTLED